MNDESESGAAGQSAKSSRRGKACVAKATRSLVLRLADCEAAIAVALAIARDERIVAQSRAAALQTVARLMASAARIGTSLAQMNGGTNHRVMVEKRSENGQKNAGKNMDRRPLSTAETAQLRQKLKTSPHGEGTQKIFHAGEEPSPHLPPFRVR